MTRGWINDDFVLKKWMHEGCIKLIRSDIKDITLLQKKSVSNKWCSFELILFIRRSWKKKRIRVFTTILSSTAVFIMKTRVMAAENSALHHRSKLNCKIYQIEVILNFNRFLLYFWLNKYSLVEHMRLLSKTLNKSYQPQTFEQRISCLEI